MNRQPKVSKTTEFPLFQLRPGKRRGGGVDSGPRSTMGLVSSPPVLSLEMFMGLRGPASDSQVRAGMGGL